MRRYYLRQRKGIFYAELVTPEGSRLTAKSTGKTTEDEALLVVSKWLSEGIPKKGKEKPVETVIGLSEILKSIRKTDLDCNDAMKIIEALKKKELVDFAVTKTGSGSKLFTEFLEEFWDWNSSTYVQERKTSGKTIGRRHCYEMLSRVHTYYMDYFANRSLDSITWQDIRDFSLFLSKKRKKPDNYKGNFAEELSAAYRNKILIAGKTALKWAFAEELITTDPTARKVSCAGKKKKRGVLTPLEAETVFNEVQWTDKRSYVGNLLSMTTAMRAGEILAVRESDIGNNVLFVRHSWSTMDGLKATKTEEERKVPLLPDVKKALMELLKQNPHKDSQDKFVFYGLLEDKPMDQKILIYGLKAACKAAGIDAKTRNIVFHSHRHYFAARLADKMTAE
jgi:integrase